jgi:hypothetical protein
MLKFCFVGLPRQLRTRLEARANRREIEITSLIVDVGRKGSLSFVPNTDFVRFVLQSYTLSLGEELALGKIFVLPYVPLSNAITEEVVAWEELGGAVVRLDAGGGQLPSTPTGRLNQPFLDHLFSALIDLLPQTASPSEYFKEVAARNPRFLLPSGAIEYCDEVGSHRHDFMIRVAKSFETLLHQGSGGRIDAFFQKLGLEHAQTGGITASLELEHDKGIYEAACNTHIKQGDNTSPAGAARVYDHAFELNQQNYVAMLYAGPHPEVDVRRRHTVI